MTFRSVQEINVRMIYSACVVLETTDLKILCDPWFTDGVYDGSWFLYPKTDDPISVIGECDYVYVSHIHPDHYDPVFLQSYFEKYGQKEILIADFPENYLSKVMQREGFSVRICADSLKVANSTVTIRPHVTNSQSDIDSALLLEYQDTDRVHRVLNLNDCIFDAEFLSTYNFEERIDILLLGYTGAGPYPQTYFDLSDPALGVAAENKKQQFFDRYLATVNAVPSKVRIPFAGQYLLGGSLASLNPFRGVADAIEVTSIDKGAVVLEEYEGSIGTSLLQAISPRIQEISRTLINGRIGEIGKSHMRYELIADGLITDDIVLNLLGKALVRARRKSECKQDYFFCFQLIADCFAVLNANMNATGGVEVIDIHDQLPEPRSVISMDVRYLFGLITGVFHWNNAEVGSQFQSRRTPDQFSREAQNFLYFLTV